MDDAATKYSKHCTDRYLAAASPAIPEVNFSVVVLTQYSNHSRMGRNK